MEVSRSHAGALHRLEEQERSHRALMHKSNCLTALLEEDRERLVHQTLEVQMNAEAKANIDIPTDLVACVEATLVETSVPFRIPPDVKEVRIYSWCRRD